MSENKPDWFNIAVGFIIVWTILSFLVYIIEPEIAWYSISVITIVLLGFYGMVILGDKYFPERNKN